MAGYRAITDKLRMAEWAAIAVLLVVILWFVAPQQIPVIGYKIAIVTFFAFLGYWIDRRLFHHSRCGEPGDLELDAQYQLRRAIVIGAVVLAGALAL